jgi:hypothetical protein
LIGPTLISHVMNVARAETLLVLKAQITEINKNRSIFYSPVHPIQISSKDKNNIIKAHIDACVALLNRTGKASDQIIIEKEIAELKIVLDLIKYVS